MNYNETPNIVILDSAQMGTSGGETYSLTMAEMFSGLAIRVLLDSQDLDSHAEVCKRSDYYVISLPTLNNDNGSLLVLLLSILLENIHPIFFIINFSPCASLIYHLNISFQQAKVICVIHDLKWLSYTHGTLGQFVKAINNPSINRNIYASYLDGVYAYHKADAVVCLSKDTVDILVSYYKVPSSLIHLIPNGMGDGAMLKSLSPCAIKSTRRNGHSFHKNRKINFLFVGRLTKEKGIDILLYAFAKIQSHFSNVTLTLVGEVTEYVIQLRCSNPELFAGVHITGFCHRNKMREIYLNADCGIISSLHEQCSYVGIEMKCYGLPVIASHTLGVRNMFSHSNGIVFNNSKIDLYEKMSFFLSLTTKEREQYGERSRKDYLNRYSIIRMKEEYHSLFNWLRSNNTDNQQNEDD